MPYLGRSSNFGVRTVFQYLPSAGDTSVSGADANGKTLSFADGNYVDVYLNGVKLKTGTDYNTTTANTIAGLTALASNDEVTVVVYDAFSLATGFETLGGTFGGAVTISDTTASSSATTGALIVSGGVGVAADLSVGDDLRLISDSSVLSFGADSDVTVTHDPDDGLILKSTATGDDNPFLLTLQTGETDIAANDVIGAINFQAPDEGTGTDAILVAAGIEAVSEGDFSSSSNATKLSFKTAASAAAAETMALSSGGNLTVSGTIVPTGAITANAGVVVDNITIDGTEIDLSSGDLTLDVAGDIILDAGGDEVIFKDGSTNVGHASLDADNFTLKSLVSDKDFIVQGNDGGTGITALTLDMSAAGAATFNNNVTAFSDERLKSDITTLKSSLEKVLQMRGVSYTRNDNVEGGEQIGVIAQEVEQFYPQVVLTADDEQGTKSVDYGRLTAVLIEAVKELSELVNRDIASIKRDIDAICQHPLWVENQVKGE